MPMNPQHRPGGLTHFGRYLYALWLRAFLEASGYTVVEIWPSSARAGQTTDPGLQNSHPGTLNGGPTLEAAPVVDDDGFAYDFDGVDDYSQVPDDGELDFGSSDSFTVIHWLTLPQSFFDNDETYLFGKEDSNGEYLISCRGNQENVRVFLLDSNGNNTNSAGGSLSAGTAHMCGMRVDRSVEEVVALADKTRGTAADTSAIGDPSNGSDLFWGRRPDGSGGGNHLPGKMGVRAIVADAVSNSDLDTIYDVGADRSNR